MHWCDAEVRREAIWRLVRRDPCLVLKYSLSHIKTTAEQAAAVTRPLCVYWGIVGKDEKEDL